MHNAIPMQLLVASDATSADLHILGNVSSGSGWFGMKEDTDTDAIDVAQALAGLPDTCTEVTVHINSMGGEVSQGVAIYNALKASKAHVTTVCEGFACSVASVIFMAGDTRIMRNASLLMVHEAWMRATGDAKGLRKAADDLDTITELSKRAYMEHATDALTREKLDRLMAEETWILPEQALEYGLATEVETAGEDEDEPEQSAMCALMRRVTEPMALTNTFEVAGFDVSDESVERIAQAIAEKLARHKGEPAPDTPQTFMQRAARMFADH